MFDILSWWRSLGDRRKYFRRQMHEPALIKFGNDSVSQGCVITNLSNSGARLLFANCNDLPDEFTLLVPRRCRIVRLSVGDVGVRFVDGKTIDMA